MASRTQRRRQLERQRWQRRETLHRAAAARAAERRRVGGTVAAVAVGTALMVWLAVWQGGYTPAGDVTAAPAAPATTSPPPPPQGCAYEDSGAPAAREVGRPPAQPLPARSATLVLSAGRVQVELLPEAAPCAVGSFAFLAAAGYFDATTCHRLTTSPALRVLQCGDPTGTGSGGPGYRFPDEGLDGATYPAGTVAMANTGPDSNGSQFFLVYGDSQLPASYTVFGRVGSGLEVLTTIAQAGVAPGGPSPTDGPPAQPVTIEDVVVESTP